MNTCAITCIILSIVSALTAVAISIALWSWSRTLRSMRAARDDMLEARSTYDTALRELGYERRQS